MVKAAYPEFDQAAFIAGVLDDNWENRELKERTRHISHTLHDFLPAGYRAALAVLRRAAPLLANYGFQNMVFADYTHPDDVEMSRRLAEELREGKIPSGRLQKRYYRKDGELVWVDMAVSAVLSPDGEFQYFIAMIEDITERKRAEEALRESEERFSTVFHHSPMGIAIFLASRAASYINGAVIPVDGGHSLKTEA